ncbi:Heparanase [Frankliniella fusca]|uniref:Heparanase n=1 Tax=Frankliniella fusca TaxID=407009 RepID=A0AAE1HLA9_9NEOP|nr:Heparanase [Frankliniella fusca]
MRVEPAIPMLQANKINSISQAGGRPGTQATAVPLQADYRLTPLDFLTQHAESPLSTIAMDLVSKGRVEPLLVESRLATMAAPAVPYAALALLEVLLLCLSNCAAAAPGSHPGSAPWSAPGPAPGPTAAPAPAPAPWLSVAINPKKMSALVSDRFLSLTIDPMELSEHRKLGPGSVRTFAMARGMSPAYLRLAGPSSDRLRFSRGDGASHDGTATEGDLVAVGRWARDAGWHLVLGLDALSRDQKDAGTWDPRNATEMLGQADRHGFDLTLQLGYESSGLARAGLSGATVGADLPRVRALLADFPRYKSAALLGPDVVAALGALRANRDAVHFLQDEARAAAPEPDVVVWQPWSAGALSEGRDPVNEPELAREEVNLLLGRAAARRPLWIAESEDAAPRTFAGALQWARRVQVAERAGADVIFRRWHSPGDDHQPTPDFWVSLLHKRLCGRAVLDTRLAGNRSAASVTARCTAAPPAHAPAPPRANARFTGSFTKLSYERGDVTLFAVNAGPVEAKVVAKFSPAAGLHQTTLHEYILTACDGGLDVRCALLNGQELGVNNGGGLPGLTPRVRQSGADRETTLVLPPHSVAFFVFPGAQSRACQTAPPSAAEAEADKVPLQLSPRRAQDVEVQFHIEGLSKSKTKDKLAATLKDTDNRQNVLLEGDAQPSPWGAPTSMEQYADTDEPRTKRATALPGPAPAPGAHHSLRPAALAALEDWHDRLSKAPASALKRKHALPPPAKVADELPEDSPSTIAVPSWYRPDDEDEKKTAVPHKHHRLAIKPLKLPKRMPLPVAPHLPKRHPPAHAHAHAPAPPRHKPLPKGMAVATLMDPGRGESAEDAVEEVEQVTVDPFPTGDVEAEVGESGEEGAAGGPEGQNGDYEYVDDDEGDEEGPEVPQQQPHPGDRQPVPPPEASSQFDNENVNEKTPYYFAPGEFMQQYSAVSRAPLSAPAGEIGEMDMIVEPMTVVQPTTPPPYEPHLEEFVERYLREKKMILKQNELDSLDCEKGGGVGPSAPTEEEMDMPLQQHVRRRRQLRTSLPSGASVRPYPRTASRPALRDEEATARRQLPSGLREELEQRVRERRERLERTRESAREQADREERLTRAREQLERAREAAREQPDREDRLTRAREQLEQQREQREKQREEQREEREQAERERVARAREQRERQREDRVRPSIPAPAPARRRSERVKRSVQHDQYMDSFGRQDYSQQPGGADWLRVAPPAPAVHHYPHGHGDAAAHGGSFARRYKYGYAPKPERFGVRNDVVRKTNVRRYKTATSTAEAAASTERAEAAERNQLLHTHSFASGRRQQYQPHDNVAVLWEGSPLSPLQHQYRPGSTPRVHVEVPVEVNVVPKPVFTPVEADAESAEQLGDQDGEEEEEAPTEIKTTQILKTERTYEAAGPSDSSSSAEESGYSSGEAVDAEPRQYASLEIPSQQHLHHHHHHHQYSGDGVEQTTSVEASTSDTASSSEECADDVQSPILPPEAEGDAGPIPVFPFREPPGPKHHVIGFKPDDSSPGGWYTFASTSHYSPPKNSAPPAAHKAPENYPSAEVHRTSKKYSRVSPAQHPKAPVRIQYSDAPRPQQRAHGPHATSPSAVWLQTPRTEASQSTTRSQASKVKSSILEQVRPSYSRSWSTAQHEAATAPKPSYSFISSHPQPAVKSHASQAARKIAAPPAPPSSAVEQYEGQQVQQEEQSQEEQTTQLEQQQEEQQQQQYQSQEEQAEETPDQLSEEPLGQTEEQPQGQVVKQPEAQLEEKTGEESEELPQEEQDETYASFVQAAPRLPVTRGPLALQPSSHQPVLQKAQQSVFRPVIQPAPQPAQQLDGQPSLYSAIQPAPQPAPQATAYSVIQSAPQPAPQQAPHLVRRPATGSRRASQQTNAPLALSYLAKYFRPVQEQTPKFQQVSYPRGRTAPAQRSAWQMTAKPSPAAATSLWDRPAAAPADDLWDQPAAAPKDNLWGQPAQPAAAPKDSLWGQPAPAAADTLWGRPAAAPARSDDLWGQPAAAPTDDLWGQADAAPAGNVWGRPDSAAATAGNRWGKVPAARVDNLWGQPVPVAAADDQWGQAGLAALAPSAPTARGAHVASLEQPAGEQLLDYNTHILRRRPGSEEPKVAAVQVASLAPAGGEVVVPVRRPLPAASAPSAPVSSPIFGLPYSRLRRSLPDDAPAPALASASADHRRNKRGFLDRLTGGDNKKVMLESKLLAQAAQAQDRDRRATAAASDKGVGATGAFSLVEEVGGSKPDDDPAAQAQAKALMDKLSSMMRASDGNETLSSVLGLLPWRLYPAPVDVNDEEWSAETERMRRKKQERQERRQRQEAGGGNSIQFMGGENSFMSGLIASLLGKVGAVIGYLERMTHSRRLT